MQAFLSLDAYRRMYMNTILPPEADKVDIVPDFTQPSDNAENQADILIPPHTHPLARRPPKRRIRSGVEGPFGLKCAKRCGRCKRLEHSMQTCNEPI